MRVAYLGLAYHAKTGSARFLLDLLARHTDLDTFFAEPDPQKLRMACAGFDERAYDAIIIWQLHEAFALLSGRHANVTYAPMYDAMWRGGAFIWKPSFNKAKVLCFSRTLHAEVMRRAPVHAYAQFFPDPAAFTPPDPGPGLHGMLWYRRREIPPQTIFSLTEGTTFESLTIHDAPDPGHEAPFPTVVPSHLNRLSRTEWTSDGRTFAEAQAAANVFFAPRPLEGIGMSFLEAMARGRCVVAPDAPTMNEYISHGVNGLLYALDRPTPRDFSRVRDIGARARDDVTAGHARWNAALPALTEFLLRPTAQVARDSGMRRVRGNLPAMPADLAAAGITPVPPGAVPHRNALWLVHAPPGSRLDPAPLAEATAAAPADVAVMRGHHLAIQRDGRATLHRADDLAAAWTRLVTGEAGPEGLGVPEATLIRADFLRERSAEMPTTAPALAALLLDCSARSHVVDAVLATRPATTASDRADWIALVARREGADAGRRLAEAFATTDAATAARQDAAAPARGALALVGLADRFSPALGRLAERIVYSPRLRRALRR